MCSEYEGTPMCALEAQCLGIPIVSTPTDGLIDIVKNDYNGFLCNDNNEIAKKIINILNDDIMINQMKDNSKINFKTLNNIDSYKELINNEYI